MTTLLDRPADAPELGTWQVDRDAALVGFSGRAHRLAPLFAAVFRGVTGELVLEPGGRGSVDVEVDVRTLTTGFPAYDEVLERLDPFDAALHPTARYRSTEVTWGRGLATVEGTLTAAGARVPVRLLGSYRSTGARTTLRATGSVDRRALGLSLDVPGTGLLLPRLLQLEVDVAAVRA